MEDILFFAGRDKRNTYVFTLAMCAQPAGQIIYGALFDWFSDSPYFVLIPSGILVCIIGLLLQ